MPLPDVTHLQFLILDLVRLDDHTGRFLRERLAEEGVKMSGPAFYQLMARLEEAGYITGWYESFVVQGQTIKERRYEITTQGKRVHRNVRSFYSVRMVNSPSDNEPITDSPNSAK